MRHMLHLILLLTGIFVVTGSAQASCTSRKCESTGGYRLGDGTDVSAEFKCLRKGKEIKCEAKRNGALAFEREYTSTARCPGSGLFPCNGGDGLGLRRQKELTRIEESFRSQFFASLRGNDRTRAPQNLCQDYLKQTAEVPATLSQALAVDGRVQSADIQNLQGNDVINGNGLIRTDHSVLKSFELGKEVDTLSFRRTTYAMQFPQNGPSEIRWTVRRTELSSGGYSVNIRSDSREGEVELRFNGGTCFVWKSSIGDRPFDLGSCVSDSRSCSTNSYWAEYQQSLRYIAPAVTNTAQSSGISR